MINLWGEEGSGGGEPKFKVEDVVLYFWQFSIQLFKIYSTSISGTKIGIFIWTCVCVCTHTCIDTCIFHVFFSVESVSTLPSRSV